MSNTVSTAVKEAMAKLNESFQQNKPLPSLVQAAPDVTPVVEKITAKPLFPTKPPIELLLYDPEFLRGALKTAYIELIEMVGVQWFTEPPKAAGYAWAVPSHKGPEIRYKNMYKIAKALGVIVEKDLETK